MASEVTETVKCGVVKRGVVDLRCERPDGHEDWHRAVFTDHREIVYDGAHHVVDITETVTWEPAEVHFALRKRARERRAEAHQDT